MIGMGQSDFFAYWRLSRLADVFVGKRRPARQDLGPLAYAVAPRALRTAMVARKPLLQMPWLRPEAAREGRRAMARRMAEAPLRYDQAVRVEREHRCHLGSLRCLEATSAVAGTELVVPYYDPAFHTTNTRLGWLGPGGRGSALRAQVGHLLPEHAFGRSDSTNFRGVFWGHRTRAFAESWSGRGLDEEMVDPEALRKEWLSDEPDLRTAMLMQLAWLAEESRREEKDQVDTAAPLAGQNA
jgi:asparagine synthase (glutamine-hydrolysing)